MEAELTVPQPGCGALLLEHARSHKPAAAGLGIALLGVLAGFALMMVLDTSLG